MAKSCDGQKYYGQMSDGRKSGDQMSENQIKKASKIANLVGPVDWLSASKPLVIKVKVGGSEWYENNP